MRYLYAFLALFAMLAPAGAGELKPVKGALMAGDFVTQDLKGQTARFNTLQGKVVLLNFWATWCTTCRKELPSMEALHQAYKNQGLVVLAVSQDRASARSVQAYAEELKLSFQVWHDRDGLIGRQYGIPGVPASYLIGADGRIAYRVLGEYDWYGTEARAAVETLLAARFTLNKPR
ncbi:MAG: TlpA family protein disulfide reductase [Hydrogenophilales bacterium]|nr:TlpA family protein disulfide reductase [Hydrogenophilales bacterium]